MKIWRCPTHREGRPYLRIRIQRRQLFQVCYQVTAGIDVMKAVVIIGSVQHVTIGSSVKHVERDLPRIIHVITIYPVKEGAQVKSFVSGIQSEATCSLGKWYVNGNYVDGSPANTADNWAGVSTADPAAAKALSAFDLGYAVNTEAAVDAFASVMQRAGCSRPNRDTLDQRIVENVRNRTGRIIDVQGAYPHGTPYDQTVGAWPALASLPAPVDSDHDGMPDSYETAHGLNPNDAADRNGYASNGYTNLENYLNGLTMAGQGNDMVVK